MTTETATLAVFHITHWKAGSQWVQKVMQRVAPARYVEQRADHSHVLKEAIRPDGVYSPVYMRRAAFEGAVKVPHKRFVVIRDLRDSLVSWYFSLKGSHGTETNGVVRDVRTDLSKMEEGEGLRYLIRERLADMAGVQRDWLRPGELVLRYEDMIADEFGAFRRVCDHCEIAIGDAELRQIVEACTFERLTGGRKRGEESRGAHYRKGVAGDWREHFDETTKAAFKERFGALLVSTGYERDDSW
ncbi:MAG: sulfotransferase domain-containing protein [Phycisphaerae bacterium]|nr:sulfotransferase domain-containing protein [Phycisphaerae bacterium]